MKETQSKILPNRIEHNTGGKKSLKTAFQVISTSILIISLGMAVFLPFRKIAVSPALAAPLPGVPVDDVTWVKTTDTSQFQTPNNPIDDSIEYVHTAADTESDSFEYEICDGATIPVCVKAEVSITINTATLAATVDSPQTLSGDVITPISADADDATVVFNSWVNIDVLANDVWGDDGPGTSAIRLGEDCGVPGGPEVGDCSTPTKGDASVNTGPRSPDPTGLAYLDGHPTADYTDKLLISDSEVNEIFPPNPAAYAGVNLFLTDLSGALTPTLDGDGKYYRFTTLIDPPDFYSDEPTGVAYKPTNNHLFFTDDNRNRIYEVDPGSDGLYHTIDPSDIREFRTTIMGSLDPSGIAYDSWRDHLIIVDEAEEEVYDIDLGPNGKLDQSDLWTSFDVASLGVIKPEGVEFNPDNGHLYIASSHWTNLIAETTIDGKLLRYLDLSSVPMLSNMSGLAYIPQANGSNINTLYIVDRNVDNDPPTLEGSAVLLGDPLENDGKMFEVTFDRNAPPYVDAGLDQAIALPTSVNLDGTVIDDGLPTSGTLTTSWSMVSGPGLVTFGNASMVDTTASFSLPGTYILNLEAVDGGAHDVSDQVTITVNPPGNEPPTVDAGPDQIINLPDSALLDGTVTDDGMPIPPILTTLWVKASGPGLVTFGDETAVDTTASFSLPGVYVLRLTADDGELSNYDEVTITVISAPLQNVWLPLILK